MTVAERLRPRPPHRVDTGQCCVPMVDSKAWATHYLERRRRRAAALGWNYEQCTRGASVEIDGKLYCGQHGGQMALAILLCEEVDWSQPGDVKPRASA
jgi:hypothetical protein